MSEGKINEEVLKALQEKTKSNENLRKFLIDLLFIEREQTGRWHFKKAYEDKIKKYSQTESDCFYV